MNDCVRNHPELLCGMCYTGETCMSNGGCGIDGMGLNYNSHAMRVSMYGKDSPMLSPDNPNYESPGYWFAPLTKEEQEAHDLWDSEEKSESSTDTTELDEAAVAQHILYRVFDAKYRLLYVGMTLNVANRMKQHGMSKNWWSEVTHIMLERFESRAELAAAERRVIVTEKPRFNKQHNGAQNEPTT